MNSQNSKWKIQIHYSNKNHKPILKVKPNVVIVTLPENTEPQAAYDLIEKQREWIGKRHKELLEAWNSMEKIELVERSDKEFRELLHRLVEKASSDILRMNPCRIVIRKMKTRWASCSPKGTLTVNSYAEYLPDHLLLYIVYHEICHVLESKHNKYFWDCVGKHVPRYRELERELVAYELKLDLNK